MSVIHIPRKHAALPAGRLAASAEYEGRLALLIPFYGDSAGRCLVTGAAPTYPSQPLAYSYTPLGLLLNCADWNQSAMTIPVSVAGSPVTVVLSGRKRAGVVAWMLHGAGNWTATYGESFQNVKSTNSGDFSGDLALTDNGLPIDPGNQVLAATMGGANDLRAVVNGGQVYADTSCSAVSGTMHTLRFGADHANGNKSDITVRFAAVLRGATSSEELRLLSGRPGALFRADPIRIYSLPSGPIGISWSSLTASNITQTGATLTLGGITR